MKSIYELEHALVPMDKLETVPRKVLAEFVRGYDGTPMGIAKDRNGYVIIGTSGQGPYVICDFRKK